MAEGIWAQLKDLLGATEHRAVVVAPFIKRRVFEELLAATTASEILCVTRWSAIEVAAGVSDPEIIEAAAADGRVTILLKHDLHAKLYAGDARCLVGSANLTGKAVGWDRQSNVELLVEVGVDHPEVVALLELLLQSSTVATPELAAAVRRQAETLLRTDWVLANPAQAGDTEAPVPWYPLSRTPEMLFDFYSGKREEATFGALDSAAYDLVHLDLPPGLDRASFKEAVRQRLRALPAVEAIVEQGRMRSSDLEAALEDTARDPGAAERALTLTRWIVEFLGDEFYTAPTHEYDIIRGRRLDEPR